MATATLALVGDRSPGVRAHGRIPQLLDALRTRERLVLDPYWIASDDADALEAFDGIWVVPGSPYRDPAKVVRAVGVARERGIPFLGTCGGFQHAILHLAEHLAGVAAPRHAEYGEGDGSEVIVALDCSLVGHEGPIVYTPGTLIARIAGVERSLERYHCSYGIAPAYIARLERAGVRFGAHDQDGAPRALELPGDPFFLGTLFQPELAGDGTRAHPVIRAFAAAVAARADSTIAPWPNAAPDSRLAGARSSS